MLMELTCWGALYNISPFQVKKNILTWESRAIFFFIKEQILPRKKIVKRTFLYELSQIYFGLKAKGDFHIEEENELHFPSFQVSFAVQYIHAVRDMEQYRTAETF